ncbi:MAG TPA: alpha-amylase, partial [Burkholderiales bacterium]|nr:alpha-amylase [Burkholderiales bacterium]
GELHRALCTRTGDAAFDPEPVSERDLEQWKAAVHTEATATLELLAARRGQMTAPARDDAAELLERRRKLFARIERLRLPRETTLKSRIHGDYHLGQVLLSKLDIIITDFEGEPARSFDQRRAKHSPLKDVAGMLRSFNYARWSALRQALEGHADYERLAPHAEGWEARARRAFLGAYDEAARGSGLYASFDDLSELLELFELEKALYELRYELDHRPGWVGIPLTGILALLD